MTSLITNHFRQTLAQNLINLITTENLYLFIGRSQNWTTENYAGNAGVSEIIPPTPVDSEYDFGNIYDNMIAIKKIAPTDIALMVKKYSWSSGTTFDMYKPNYSPTNPSASGATNLVDSKHYCVNSNFQVFKCIYNGQTPENPLGIPTQAGYEPVVSGSPTAIITTADGYRWKYIYTLTTQQVLDFANNNYIPVVTDSIIAAAAVSGAINQVLIKNRGTTLTPGTYYTPVIGNGSGAIISITVSNDTNSTLYQKISSVTMSSVGSGYTFAEVDLSNCFSDVALTTSASIGTITNPTNFLEAVVSPIGGHGIDPAKELGAYRLLIAPKLLSIDDDVPVNIQFRQYGLLYNPTKADLTGNFVSYSGNVAKKIKLPTAFVGNFTAGETITQTTTNATGMVINYNPVSKVIMYYQNEYSDVENKLFSGNNLITGSGSASSLPDVTYSGTVSGTTFTNGYATSEISAYSGKILYVENRPAINRALDQDENFYIILEM